MRSVVHQSSNLEPYKTSSGTLFSQELNGDKLKRLSWQFDGSAVTLFHHTLTYTSFCFNGQGLCLQSLWVVVLCG